MMYQQIIGCQLAIMDDLSRRSGATFRTRSPIWSKTTSDVSVSLHDLRTIDIKNQVTMYGRSYDLSDPDSLSNAGDALREEHDWNSLPFWKKLFRKAPSTGYKFKPPYEMFME